MQDGIYALSFVSFFSLEEMQSRKKFPSFHQINPSLQEERTVQTKFHFFSQSRASNSERQLILPFYVNVIKYAKPTSTLGKSFFPGFKWLPLALHFFWTPPQRIKRMFQSHQNLKCRSKWNVSSWESVQHFWFPAALFHSKKVIMNKK